MLVWVMFWERTIWVLLVILAMVVPSVRPLMLFVFTVTSMPGDKLAELGTTTVVLFTASVQLATETKFGARVSTPFPNLVSAIAPLRVPEPESV